MQKCSLGERLREERERLDLNQEQLGTVGGVNRNSQGKYEKDVRNPDATYLAAIAAAGVDVLYVVTGQRMGSGAKDNPVDTDRMIQIAERLEAIAKQAGKRWPTRQLVGAVVEVYNFLLEEEEAVDDAKLERVLKLVVSR